MPQKINQFSHGGFIEFDKGKFDEWCVFVTRASGERFAPTDVLCFSRLKILAETHGHENVYFDFVAIYNRTEISISKNVLELISVLSHLYGKDALEVEIWFNVLYAGMIA